MRQKQVRLMRRRRLAMLLQGVRKKLVANATLRLNQLPQVPVRPLIRLEREQPILHERKLLEELQL